MIKWSFNLSSFICIYDIHSISSFFLSYDDKLCLFVFLYSHSILLCFALLGFAWLGWYQKNKLSIHIKYNKDIHWFLQLLLHIDTDLSFVCFLCSFVWKIYDIIIYLWIAFACKFLLHLLIYFYTTMGSKNISLPYIPFLAVYILTFLEHNMVLVEPSQIVFYINQLPKEARCELLKEIKEMMIECMQAWEERREYLFYY